VKAGADRERFKNEGQAYANDVIPKAQGTSSRLREEAEAYRARVIAQAEGDASRFRQVLTEYEKAPAVTRDRLYVDTMREVYSNVSKVMVDVRGGSNLLYLPLDKLMQASGAQAPAAAGVAEPTPMTPAATVDTSRSRDNQRSREREGR
jgi:membrane protease subunit HflK